MRFLLFIFSFLFSANLFAGELTIDDVKKKYNQAIYNSNEAKQLDKLLSNQKLQNNLMLAYYGATKGLLAKHASNPFNKLSYLDESLKHINSAVNKEPNNIEIRYIRFTIQSQIPEFVGKSKDFYTDKYFLISAVEKAKISKNNKNQLEEICEFLIQYGKCTAAEKNSLSSILKNCKTPLI
jgi:hypothetical protein